MKSVQSVQDEYYCDAGQLGKTFVMKAQFWQADFVSGVLGASFQGRALRSEK